MNILLISPPEVPVRPESKYLGIERMVWEYARQLIKNHKVTVMGHADSIYPEGVQTLPIKPQPNKFPELQLYQTHQSALRTFDVIHDWSHLHLASRYTVNLPSLNLFFHAPALVQYAKAPYNIISFSQWGAREFERIYHQKARYQQSIGIDPAIYCPKGKRGNRFLTIGRMAPEKGNLQALHICKAMGVPLDIVGGRGFEKNPNEPLTDYEKAIQEKSDGKIIKLWGEVAEDRKVKLMQSCCALLYCSNHPEVTSHKIQECMFCEAPVIVPTLGAMHEIVTDKVNGYLCREAKDYVWAIEHLDDLEPEKAYDALIDKYSIGKVVERYIPLYEEVANGLRW